MHHRRLQLLFAFTAAAALTACGGGGSDAPASSSPPTSPAQAPVNPPPAAGNGTLQASVPTANYDARRKAAYDELNAARRGAGAGLLAQSAQLDASASSHAAYLTVNGFGSAASPHYETAGLTDFTGADPFVRMKATGYSYSFASEVIGDIGSTSATSDCVGDLLDTIYHAADMLSRETDVGIGFGSGSAAGMCTIDLASSVTDSRAQVPPSGAIIAYPYDGATVATGTFRVSSESPRAPTALLPNATAGTPILVGFRNQDYVNAGKDAAATISQFSLADSAGNLVPTVILADSSVSGSGVNDDTGLDGGVVSGFAALVPKSPLPVGRYTVTLHAAVTGGQALTLTTWTFTVAAP